MKTFFLCQQGIEVPNCKENFLEDSGLNIPLPEDIIVPANSLNFPIDLKVKVVLVDRKREYHPFLLMPRSSMGSKTPLVLANSVGLIDKGYRGTIKAFVHNLSSVDIKLEKGTSIFQVVSPTLEPWSQAIYVTEEDTIFNKTLRDEGGFGSTGI